MDYVKNIAASNYLYYSQYIQDIPGFYPHLYSGFVRTDTHFIHCFSHNTTRIAGARGREIYLRRVFNFCVF